MTNLKLNFKKFINNGKFTKAIYEVVFIAPVIVDEESVKRNKFNLENYYAFESINGLRFCFDVSGVSRCHDDDEFDPIYGRDLAENRAILKAYQVIDKICDWLYSASAKRRYELMEFQDQLDRKREARKALV